MLDRRRLRSEAAELEQAESGQLAKLAADGVPGHLLHRTARANAADVAGEGLPFLEPAGDLLQWNGRLDHPLAGVHPCGGFEAGLFQAEPAALQFRGVRRAAVLDPLIHAAAAGVQEDLEGRGGLARPGGRVGRRQQDLNMVVVDDPRIAPGDGGMDRLGLGFLAADRHVKKVFVPSHGELRLHLRRGALEAGEIAAPRHGAPDVVAQVAVNGRRMDRPENLVLARRREGGGADERRRCGQEDSAQARRLQHFFCVPFRARTQSYHKRCAD